MVSKNILVEKNKSKLDTNEVRKNKQKYTCFLNLVFRRDWNNKIEKLNKMLPAITLDTKPLLEEAERIEAQIKAGMICQAREALQKVNEL